LEERKIEYWEKAFDTTNREALSFKMREIGVRENMICCIKKMQQDMKHFVFG
jgi:hypothetical protein